MYTKYNSFINKNLISWFGKSKIVDNNGDPKLVFHGSKGDFSEFDIKFFGQGDNGFFGKGFYFSSSEDIAKGYASHVSDYKINPGLVRKFYLKMETPLYINGDTGLNEEWLDLRFDDLDKFEKDLRDNYDGVVYTGTRLSDNVLETQYMVLNPNQIKSNKNSGKFGNSNNVYETYE